MKSYKFLALVTLDPPGKCGSVSLPEDETRRMAVLGQNHQTHGSQVFSALVTNKGEGSPWIADDHVIVTIVLVGDDARECLDIGDNFTLWLGDGTGHGVVTRRLFI